MSFDRICWSTSTEIVFVGKLRNSTVAQRNALHQGIGTPFLRSLLAQPRSAFISPRPHWNEEKRTEATRSIPINESLINVARDGSPFFI